MIDWLRQVSVLCPEVLKNTRIGATTQNHVLSLELVKLLIKSLELRQLKLLKIGGACISTPI